VKVLVKLGVIDPTKERVHNIGLIVGGSTFQPFHFDVAKVSKNKDCYDEAMALPHSPAAILLGFSGAIRLGVKDDQVKMLPAGEAHQRTCQIEGGVPGEEFVVAGYREQTSIRMKKEYTDKICIIESDGGFIFKGDFVHSGAPTVASAEKEKIAWKSVNKILMDYSVEEDTKDKRTQEEVFEKLLGVPHLDTVTRFHCMVVPKMDKPFIISPGDIGFEREE
jgi:hypothetical protein